jgi:hypothetical protein
MFGAVLLLGIIVLVARTKWLSREQTFDICEPLLPYPPVTAGSAYRTKVNKKGPMDFWMKRKIAVLRSTPDREFLYCDHAKKRMTCRSGSHRRF